MVALPQTKSSLGDDVLDKIDTDLNLIRLRFVGILLVLFLTGCRLSMPGAELDDGDNGVSEFFVAVPCELMGRVDISAVSTDSNYVFIPVCDPLEYPLSPTGTPHLLYYIDYVGDAGGFGLRELAFSSSGYGAGSGFEVVGLFCDDTIEIGGWDVVSTDFFHFDQIQIAC